MKLIPEKGPWPRLLVFPLLVLALSGLAMARWFPQFTYNLAYCPLREVTGFPCLTCGGTHSIVALMRGDFIESLLANPLVFLSSFLFAAWSFFAILATVRPSYRKSIKMTPNETRATRIMATLVLTGTWIWLLMQFR